MDRGRVTVFLKARNVHFAGSGMSVFVDDGGRVRCCHEPVHLTLTITGQGSRCTLAEIRRYGSFQLILCGQMDIPVPSGDLS